MSQLTIDLKKYADQFPDHTKKQFFYRLIHLIDNNQLTLATLTQELADLTSIDRALIFNTLMDSPSINSDAALWLERLYELMGVKLGTETFRGLIEKEPSQELRNRITDARYRLWQKSPLDVDRVKHLEHELKGVLKLSHADSAEMSLAEILVTEHSRDLKQLLQVLLNIAPDYLPQLLDHMYWDYVKDQSAFIASLLRINDRNLMQALLRSNPQIVTQIVMHHPEAFFKLSEPMRVAVTQLLQDKGDAGTLHSISAIAKRFFASEQELLFVLHGATRFKDVRLSQTEQALNAIQAYLEQQPNEYKRQFFYDLAQDIRTNGLTVDLLQHHLRRADANELFAKWSGLSNSRAAGLMASLYKLANFGVELNVDELSQMIESRQLPQVAAPNNAPGQSDVLFWLQNNIEHAIKEDVKSLIALDQKESALEAIQQYLEKQPNEYKEQFFIQLYQAIQKSGLTVELLQHHLNEADTNQLFSKWSGATHSRAAELISELYTTATLGRVLDAQQLQDLTSEENKQLPFGSTSSAGFVNSKIREIIMNPDRANGSHLTVAIGQVFEEIQARAQWIQKTQHQNILNTEAVYQQYLLSKGLALAADHPVFDTQCHVLLFVTLDEKDYQNILDSLGQKLKIGLTAKETVQTLIGSELSNPTLCNFDIKNNAILENKFERWLSNDAFAFLINSTERSSIIGLQEEMSMHVLLSLRVLEEKIPSLNTHSIRNELLILVNELVEAEFQDALNASFAADSGHINFPLLNKKLDQSRAKLAPLCRQQLVDLLFDTNPHINWDEQLKSLNKHDFTSTTATGLDYLRSDVRNESLVRISATQCTAHHKIPGAHFQALRVLHRTHYEAAKDNLVTPFTDHTLEARVPSIAVKESGQRIAIKDVADKLQASHQILRNQAGYCNGPMIYNLLTSLHTLVYDNFFFERPNKQRLSAEYILHGSHLYNVRQLRIGEPKDLVYVQNVPVNQHTTDLDDSAFDDVTKEATLMTDMALLATLNHYSGVLPCALQHSVSGAYSVAHRLYLDFLQQIEENDSYFHQSGEGVAVIDYLNQCKDQWNLQEIQTMERDSLNTLVIKALFKIYASNDYRNRQFGMLVQSLSVFVEPMSQAGCKSANERYQGVSGRVDLLKSLNARSNNLLTDEERAVKIVLHDFVKGTVSCGDLQECLDTAYNQHNLYGAATVFSTEDQGAASKVKATKNKENKGVISEFDTNVAESGFLTRLHQSFCSMMQAHKANLSEIFQNLFKNKVQSQSQDIRLI